jgi:hypothetical protein
VENSELTIFERNKSTNKESRGTNIDQRENMWLYINDLSYIEMY